MTAKHVPTTKVRNLLIVGNFGGCLPKLCHGVKKEGVKEHREIIYFFSQIITVVKVRGDNAATKKHIRKFQD